MEFEIGSLADLISGSHTPHRRKATHKPLTPRKKDQEDDNITPQNKSKSNLKKPKLAFTPEDRKKVSGKVAKVKSLRQRKLLTDNIANDDDEAYESSESKDGGKAARSTKKIKSKLNKLNAGVGGKKRSQPPENSVSKKKQKTARAVFPENHLEETGDLSSSEHESDNELSDVENEAQLSKDIESNFPPSDDEDNGNDAGRTDFEKAAEFRQQQTLNRLEKFSEDEANRTIFVGNVPISKKCKKEMKKVFSQHGVIESVRIRGVPIKDLNSNPKVALIKNEIHPDRSSVIVYVKFQDPLSAEKALVENNRLVGENHIRVSRSNVSHSIHDARKSIFVGNLPHAVEDEELRKFFIKCGDISSVRVIREKKTQIGKGFGYVNFEKSDGVELALSLSEEELTLNKRVLRVRRYTQSANKQNSQGKFQRQVPGTRFQQQKQQRKGPKKAKFSQKLDEGRNKEFRPRMRIPHESRVPVNKLISKFGKLRTPESKQTKKNSSTSKKDSGNAPSNFVGFTAEKKKKKKMHKGDIKKKHLSQILIAKREE